MKTVRSLAALALMLAFANTLDAQQGRPASPRGEAATQIGGTFNESGRYEGGSWIVVDYGRPITRGRDVFGSGTAYGQNFLRGAPVWRLGANQSTRLMTEADLMFGDQRLPAGEYSMFAELTEDEWTLIFSTWEAKDSFREENPDGLWGAYEYTSDRDVLRTLMSVTTSDMSSDQMVILFTDVTGDGGTLTVWWADQMASTAFSLAK